MNFTGFNRSSLRKHQVTEKECIQVLADPFKIEVEEGESKNGNPTVLWVGATLTERVLEIGVEYMESMDWIFHASVARRKFIRTYLKSRT